MATRKSASKARGSRNRAGGAPRIPAPQGAASPDSAAPPATLEDVIEDERLRLMKAHSILSCATIAMEEGDHEQPAPYYPAILDLARDLIDETVRRLDSVKLQPFLAPLRAAQRR